MSAIAVKNAPPAAAGEFVARVFLIGGPPDADGDVITAGATPEHLEVDVSLEEHDVMFRPRTEAGGRTEAAGRAMLFSTGRAMLAYGQPHASDRGHQLRAKLLRGGPDTMWSTGFSTKPDRFAWRPPTAAELEVWPDTRRVITSWLPIEISPVFFGACGPSCRTLSAKSACGCHACAATEGEAVVAEFERIGKQYGLEPAAPTLTVKAQATSTSARVPITTSAADNCELTAIAERCAARDRELKYLFTDPATCSLPAVQRERLAELGVFACKQLQLDPHEMDMVFFTSGDDDDRLGFYRPTDPYRVYVRAGAGWQMAQALTHELVHASGVRDEGEARRLGGQLVQQWLAQAC